MRKTAVANEIPINPTGKNLRLSAKLKKVIAPTAIVEDIAVITKRLFALRLLK